MKFLFSVLLAVCVSHASSLKAKSAFPARGFAKILNDKEAKDRLDNYRAFWTRDLNSSGFHQGYAFRFRFRHMPRRGKEFFRTGTIYGLAIGHSLSRLDLDSVSGNKSNINYLFQSSNKPKVWFCSKNNDSKLLSNKELFDPIIDGMNHSPFDILMPFIFWESKYLKSGKVAGRPSHIYSFSSPEWVNEIHSDFNRVTLALDASYQAPLKIETFSKLGVPRKTLILNSLKKISDQWIVKSIDCKNNLSRSNTRFEVLSVALNLDLDEAIFTPHGILERPVISNDLFVSTM